MHMRIRTCVSIWVVHAIYKCQRGDGNSSQKPELDRRRKILTDMHTSIEKEEVAKLGTSNAMSISLSTRARLDLTFQAGHAAGFFSNFSNVAVAETSTCRDV